MRALVAPRIVAGAHVLGENETEVETGDGVYVRYNSATRELMIFAEDEGSCSSDQLRSAISSVGGNSAQTRGGRAASG